ncbi:uncharacterized protein LOC117295672 [Asterias rubens]|uniref:uncharacterized protein LOC117295672 n=1 Tax=Asterias rubens TaxID=7604 RepID=UPI00145544DB|nr:uncharacterized protein LOC117295672 [Asterias rubens]
MTDYPALNDDAASPFDSLARAKAILRQSTERAVMERRRKEQQRGLQSSMLEYTEHARSVRKSHLEQDARRGSLMRDPAFAARLEAALDVTPRKGRSPVRTTDGELRRLYGNLSEEKIKALEEKHLPEILHQKTTTRPLPGKQRGEGTDFWDIVTKDGNVKRIVVLRADDEFVNTRCRKPGDDGASSRTTAGNATDGFMSYRTDDPNFKSNALGKDHRVILPITDETRNISAVQDPTPEQIVKKPVIRIEVSIPRMEFETPSPDPSEPEDGGGGLRQTSDLRLTQECSHSELRTQEAAMDSNASNGRGQHGNKRGFLDFQSSKLQHENSMSVDGGCSSLHTVLKMPSQTFPVDAPRRELTHGEPLGTIDAANGQHHKTDVQMHELSQSSISLDDTLSYHRGFTVNTSVQTLPSRMEGILKNAMSSAQRGGPSRPSESMGGADAETPGAFTCRHGQLVATCTTCRTVDEIQRRLKTNHFRRQMRQSFQWNLQAGTALSNSSRWDGGGSGKINLVPRLKEMRAQKKKSSAVLYRQRKSGKARSGVQNATGSFMKRSVMERSAANSSLLKNSSNESLGAKKSVRFSDENVYHRMTGYYPTKDAENVVSAS